MNIISQKNFFRLLVLFLSVLLFSPMVSMFWGTLKVEQGISWSLYDELFNQNLWYSFWNSLKLALFVGVSSTIIGTLLGVLLAKTNVPFRSAFLALFVTPLLIPPYIFAYAWFELLGREGFLGELLFGFWGTAFVLFWVYLPIPLLLSRLFLLQIDPKLEESALLISGWGRVLRWVTLPLIRPAMSFSFLLVFILSFGEFSVANFFHYNILPMESFTYFSAFYDFEMATVTAMPMVFMALAILWIQRYLPKNSLRFHQACYITMIELKRAKLPFVGLLFGLVIFVLLPLISLVLKSNLAGFLIALNNGITPLFRSLYYASIGATLLMFFGFLTAYLLEEKVSFHSKKIDGLLLFLFMLPSTIIGIGLILFWNSSWGSFVYGTPLIIFLGYLGKYLFLTTKIAQVRLSQIPRTMVESAQLLGASWWQVLGMILVPLSRESLVGIWLIGFIFSLRETTITMLVYPAGSDTLPLYILTQMANGDPAVVASLCLMMVGAILLPLIGYFLWRIKRV